MVSPSDGGLAALGYIPVGRNITNLGFTLVEIPPPEA